MTLNTLYDEFYNRYIVIKLKPNTQRGYRINVQKHIIPYIGFADVKEVDLPCLDYLNDRLTDKGLSPRSIVYVHATLRKMLEFAKRRGYITHNPYDSYDLVRVPEYHHHTITMADIKEVVKLVEGTELYAPIVLAAMYGLRRGEVLGLKWTDFDKSMGVLYIQRTRNTNDGKDMVTDCKTKSSRRYILISAEHAKIFAKTDAPYIVNMSSEVLDKKWKRFRYKLPEQFHNIRFHDLRHSYATAMMKERVNPKIVSAVLGHSGVGITLDLYSHPDVEMQRQLLQIIE